MTDPAPTTAQDLGIAPAPAPTAPATPVVPNMSYDDAPVAKSQRMADPGWRGRYMKGGIAEKAEMDHLMAALSPRQPMPSDPSSVEQVIDHLRERANISEQVANQIRQNLPISAPEQLKDRLFRDREWVKRYLDGGIQEAETMALINVNLSLPVRVGE
jgi:hypothetical protein